jgi:histidinol-phosphate phosphatase family protein
VGEAAGRGEDPRPAVFFDRDGTLIQERHYLGDPRGVELLPGAIEAIKRLNGAGVPVVIVTNQSGIGRGYFSEANYHAVQRRLVQLLAAGGAWVDAVYHCPHAPDHTPPCTCRKPRPGLFERAAEDLVLDLSRSVYVGDRLRDVEPGIDCGGTGILIGTGEQAPEGVLRAETLAEVVELARAALHTDD